MLAQCETNIYAVFSSAEEVRQLAKQIYLALPESGSYFQPASVDWKTVLAGSMGELRALLPSYITDENIYTIASMEKNSLQALGDALAEQAGIQLTAGITQDAITSVLDAIRSEFIAGGSFTAREANLAYTIGNNTIEANKTFDLEATEDEKTAAAAAVRDVVYQKGQNIVMKGEIISSAQYQLITQLGLTNTSASNTGRWFFGALFLLLIFTIAGMYAFYTDRSLFEHRKTVLGIVCLTALTVVFGLVAKRIDLRLCPAFVVAILSAVVLEKRTAVF